MATFLEVDRPQVKPSTALVAIAALFLGGANASRTLAEFDLPWHLALGERIAATWSIPKTDDFAFTETPMRYVAVIADLLLYAIMRVGGPLGLQVADGLVVVAIAATLLWDAKIRTGRIAPASVAVVAAAMYSISAWTFVRPSTVGFLFTALTLLLVRIGTKGALAMAAVLPFFWANIHGSVALGIAALGAHALLRLRHREWSPLVATGVASALACINPAGPGLFIAGASIAKYDDVVIDWKHTSFRFFFVDAPATGWCLVALVLVIVFGKNADGTRRPSLFDLGLLAASAFLCLRYRFVPVAILCLTPIAASRAVALIPKTSLGDVALLVASCLAGPSVAIFDQGTLGVGFDPKNFPEPAVHWVEVAKPTGKMWNFWPYGGYLIWRLYPAHRVLLDGRIGFVHERDLTYDTVASETNVAAFAKLDARFHFDWAFCRAHENERTCLPIARSSEWTMVFLDGLAAVYVRNSGPNQALAAGGYRVLTHLTPPNRILESALSGDHAEDLAHDGALLRAQDPTAPRSWFVDACGALAVGDRARFDAARTRLAILAPGHPALLVLEDASKAR